jgi:hypothetical protein
MDKMNSIKSDVFTRYKECAGRGCQNIGVHNLKIIFLNKSGWFCDDCRNGLILDKLIDGNSQSSSSITDQFLQSASPESKGDYKAEPE